MQVTGIVRSARTAAVRALHAGRRLNLTVTRDAVPGRVVLRGGEHHISIPETPGLKPGTTVPVRILRLEPTLQLEILEPGTTTHALVGTGSGRNREDAPVEMLLRLLNRTGIDPDPDLVARTTALHERLSQGYRRGSRREKRTPLMRGALEAGQRSIDPPWDMPGLESLLGWFSGGSGSRDPSADSDAREEVENSISEDGAYLRRATEVPDHLLQLYNALAPISDVHWVVIPIRAALGSLQGNVIDAVLKVGWDHRRRVPREALLSVDRPSGARWWFRWRLTRGDRGEFVVRAAECGSDSADDPVPRGFSPLARMGFPGHTDGVEQTVESDGFALGRLAQVDLPEVDTYG